MTNTRRHRGPGRAEGHRRHEACSSRRSPLPEEAGGPDEYFEELAREGLERRLAPIAELLAAGRTKHPRKDYDERLAWELVGHREDGLLGLLPDRLGLHQVRQGRAGSRSGPGRGSAAGSLVAWTLGITEVDPLRYDLLFERFLNPDRISMPDIDIDFCERRRGEVIEYVREEVRPGERRPDHHVQLDEGAGRRSATSGAVLDVPLAEVNQALRDDPGEPGQAGDARRGAAQREGARRHASPGTSRYRKLFDLAERLEGVSRHAGMHAAGVLIAPRPLIEYLPLYRNNNDEITTQFEMKSVDKMGLLKMDFLGLITLDDPRRRREVAPRSGPGGRSTSRTIPLNDPEVFRLFSEGRTDGIFQFESSGMRDLLRRVQPSVFSDLAALNALYRPGALDAGTVEDYIERRRGQEVRLPAPGARADSSKETLGVLVYQEQVMLAARAVAGYTLGEADKLRKAIGKKDEAAPGGGGGEVRQEVGGERRRRRRRRRSSGS